jgi:hypothetical protein
MNRPFDLKPFNSALDLVEYRLVDLERHHEARAHAMTDYNVAMAAYSMMSADQKAQVSNRLSAIKHRLAALAPPDKAAAERLALLEVFFTKVASVTQSHQTDKTGRACVSPRTLAGFLANVDPRWHEKKAP